MTAQNMISELVQSTLTRNVCTMKVEFQGFVGNKFIDQHSLPLANAIPNKGDKMAMVNSANDLHFCLELSFPLATPRFQALHRHILPGGQHAFVHVPEPALPQQIPLRESGGGCSQLLI